MLLSEIDYHYVLGLSIEEYFTPKIKSDLNIIIPDVLTELRIGLRQLDVSKRRIYFHVNAAPDRTPKKIMEDVMWETSMRVIRANKELKGFDSIFSGRCFIKSGAKPSKRQMDDFVTLGDMGI